MNSYKLSQLYCKKREEMYQMFSKLTVKFYLKFTEFIYALCAFMFWHTKSFAAS